MFHWLVQTVLLIAQKQLVVVYAAMFRKSPASKCGNVQRVEFNSSWIFLSSVWPLHLSPENSKKIGNGAKMYGTRIKTLSSRWIMRSISIFLLPFWYHYVQWCFYIILLLDFVLITHTHTSYGIVRHDYSSFVLFFLQLLLSITLYIYSSVFHCLTHRFTLCLRVFV